MGRAQDPPGHMPSLAQREPEETDLDDDSFRSCQYTAWRVTFGFPPSLHIIFYRNFEIGMCRGRTVAIIQLSDLFFNSGKECPSAPRTALDATFGRFSDPRFFMQLGDLGFLQPQHK